MNDTHVPRYWKALLGVGIGVAMMIGSTVVPESNNRLFWTLFVFGIISSFFGVLQAIMASYGYYVDTKTASMRETRMLFEVYKGATIEEKAAFGHFFPEIDVEIVDFTTRYYVRGTSVPVSVFQEFLDESNSQTTIAQRNWKARGTVVAEDGMVIDYHWMWLAIYKKLVADGYIIESSHNGPRSELWHGNSYRHLCDEWLEPRNIPELAS